MRLSVADRASMALGPIRFSVQLGPTVALAALVSVFAAPCARAGAAVGKIKATISFPAIQDSGQWKLAGRPVVAEGSDEIMKARLNIVLAALSSAGPLSSFTINGSLQENGLQRFLLVQYRNLFGNIPTFAQSEPGPTNTWTMQAPGSIQCSRLLVYVPTTALPKTVGADEPGYVTKWRREIRLLDLMNEVGIAPPADIQDGQQLNSLQKALRDSLIGSATIRWDASGTTSAPPQEHSTALPLIRRMSAELALKAAAEYATSQLNYQTRIQTDLTEMVKEEKMLGPPYNVTSSTVKDEIGVTSPYPLPDADTLEVVLKGLDPVVSLAVTVDVVDLPNDKGNHPNRSDLNRLYGDSGLTRNLEAGMDRVKISLVSDLKAKYHPGELPSFINADERASLAEQMESWNEYVETVNPPLQGTPEELPLPVNYLPKHLNLTVSLNGDSVRELTGDVSLKYSPLWRPGGTYSIDIAPSLQGITAGSDYRFPFKIGIGDRFDATADIGGNYSYTRNVRLGTRGGPLVSLGSGLAGGSVTVSHSFNLGSPGDPASGVLSVQDSLSAHYRDLEGYGTPSFLGIPSTLKGMDAGDTLSASYIESGTKDNPQGGWEANGEVAVDKWLTHASPSFGSVVVSASVRRFFTGDSGKNGYIEVRGETGWLSGSAPRIDFFRLGGDQWLRGMEDGELAGRSYRSVGVEGGPNLQTLIGLIPTGSGESKDQKAGDEKGPTGAPAPPEGPSQLSNIYFYGMLETGSVSQQGNAGDDFNPSSSSMSYGLGARIFGAISNGSISFGYARSTHALHPSGRFFVSVFMLLGNSN